MPDTTPGPIPGPVFRYVADGRLPKAAARAKIRLLRHPVALALLGSVGLVYGVYVAVSGYDIAPSQEPGRFVATTLAWGAGLLLLVAILLVVLVPLVHVSVRRQTRRLFPSGSVTEVELGADELAVRRHLPTGSDRSRTLAYRDLFRVRATPPLVRLEVAGSFRHEVLPAGLLPDDAVAFIQARKRGVWPSSSGAAAAPEGAPSEGTREWVVPHGWAAHVARVYAREQLRGRRYWVTTAFVMLVSGALATRFGPIWLAAGAALCLLPLLAVYVQARRELGLVLLEGSVASTEIVDGTLVSRNTGGVRRLRLEDVTSVRVRGDVVVVRTAVDRASLLFARELMPPEILTKQ